MFNEGKDLAGLLGVQVDNYKNIQGLWLQWSSGISIFGANGAGKTNLLEALAILFGTEQTLELMGRRLGRIQPDRLGFIVRDLPSRAPGAQIADATADPGPGSPPFLRRSLAEARWWAGLGASRGVAGREGGLRSAGLPERIVQFVEEELTNSAVVRYRLSSWRFDLKDPLDAAIETEVGPPDHDESEIIRDRSYSRTLLIHHPPAWLISHASELPDIFSPFRTALAQPLPGPEGWVDFMALPDTYEPPVILEWLPRLRSSAESVDALTHSYKALLESMKACADIVVRNWTGQNPLDLDVESHVQGLVREAMSIEIHETLPDLEIKSGPGPELQISLDNGYDVSRLWYRHSALENFSSGERRWVDEALATAARALSELARTYQLFGELGPTVTEEDLLSALLLKAGELEEEIKLNGAQSADVMNLVFEIAGEAVASRISRGLSEEMTGPQVSALAQLRFHREARRVIRVFDEPEAHLHARRQREMAQSITKLRSQEQDIVIASHSPYFLELPSWQLIHAQRTPEGTTYSRLEHEDLNARGAIAVQLGITRGELLTRVGLLLMVEGEHDRMILETLYGEKLRSAGVELLCLRGTDHLLSTVELDFVERFLNVPLAVLLDSVRLDKISNRLPGNASEEEQKLHQWIKNSKRRGRVALPFGLERPDIVTYLNPEAVRESHPHFQGWREVLNQFRSTQSRPAFKKWLLERFDVDLTHLGMIEPVLDIMRNKGLPPQGELDHRVSEIISTARGLHG